MNLTAKMLGIGWVPLLSGCMMLGGAGHTGGWDGPGEAGYAATGQGPATLHRAEATSAGLTITLGLPAPRWGAAMVIDAQLRTDSAPLDSTDTDVWLRIQTPSGGVDRIQMQRLHASTPGAYQAVYRFSTTGLYLVTADGRTRTGAEVRTLSVTAGAEVPVHAAGGRHDWVTPVAILGGLGMIAMMALMMGGSTR